jgi:hypothetical protein
MKAQLHIFENRYDEAEEFLRHFLQETDLSDYPRIRGTFFSTFSKIELCKHNFESAFLAFAFFDTVLAVVFLCVPFFAFGDTFFAM